MSLNFSLTRSSIFSYFPLFFYYFFLFSASLAFFVCFLNFVFSFFPFSSSCVTEQNKGASQLERIQNVQLKRIQNIVFTWNSRVRNRGQLSYSTFSLALMFWLRTLSLFSTEVRESDKLYQ